jgi:hypothetical protein
LIFIVTALLWVFIDVYQTKGPNLFMHIQFLGASQEVTGSKYLIRGKAAGIEHCFVVDYGMFQGGQRGG